MTPCRPLKLRQALDQRANLDQGQRVRRGHDYLCPSCSDHDGSTLNPGAWMVIPHHSPGDAASSTYPSGGVRGDGGRVCASSGVNIEAFLSAAGHGDATLRFAPCGWLLFWCFLSRDDLEGFPNL